MMSTAKLDKRFWTEAVSTSSYLINRTPIKSLELKILEELQSDKLVNYNFHLCVSGCDAYMQILIEKRIKLDKNSRRCIFLGYAKRVQGYMWWDPTTHKIIGS